MDVMPSKILLLCLLLLCLLLSACNKLQPAGQPCVESATNISDDDSTVTCKPGQIMDVQQTASMQTVVLCRCPGDAAVAKPGKKAEKAADTKAEPTDAGKEEVNDR